MVPGNVEVATPVIPIRTTTIDALASTETEPGDTRTWITYAAGVGAHISSPTGNERNANGGGRETIDARLYADLTAGMAHTDRVVDNGTGLTYEVVWVQTRQGLGLDHTAAGLRRITGVGAG